MNEINIIYTKNKLKTYKFKKNKIIFSYFKYGLRDYMKNLFLTAKYYTMKDDRKVVNIDDFLKATTALFFTNKDIINSIPKEEFRVFDDDFFLFMKLNI